MNGWGQRPVYNRAEGSVTTMRTHDPTGHIDTVAFAIIAAVTATVDSAAGHLDPESS
jgi:hypothetical protein